MSTPIPAVEPQAALDEITHLVLTRCADKIILQTRYGVPLSVDEIWFSHDSGAVHVSVNLPADYELTKRS